ncbi:MAG: zf-HC2 domain-containing protein [Tyzzerella sp.]|nr:zf-HC2 domain-containing protein [Tyzzerella sp.]
MKNDLDCRIVRDLLPSYVDGLTCDFTTQEIEEHVKECEECSRILLHMKEPEQHEDVVNVEVDYLKKIRGRTSRLLTIGGASTIILVLGLIVGLMLYNRIVPKDFLELFPEAETSKILVLHSQSDAEMELTGVECKTLYSLLEDAGYYYNGRQTRATAIHGDEYNMVAFDADGNKIFEFCITDEYYVYAEDKIYDVRNDEEIMEFIDLRIVSEAKWIEWEKELYGYLDGAYMIESEEDWGSLITTLQFDLEEHTCMFPQSVFSSVYPGGTFRIKDDKVVVKRYSGKDTYIFEIVDDETIRFVQEGSSEIPLGDGRNLPDGTVFKLVDE